MNASSTKRSTPTTAAHLAALQIAAANRRLPANYAYCPRCDMVGPTIDDGETCARCKLVAGGGDANMSVQEHQVTPRSAPIPATLDRLQQHHQDQARISSLERVLADCLHYIAVAYGMPSENDEPECSIRAKTLLGWPR
jgi:hypothetical protein